MNNHLLFSLPNNTSLALALAEQAEIELGRVEFHEFPDGEYYLRVESPVKDKIVMLVCTLDHPNNKLLPLLFLAQTLRELGAQKICLIAPYLPYLRQDKHFKIGDALTSAIFSKLLSGWVDGLLTIDPHLHRIHDLAEVYAVPNLATLHATTKIAEWISNHVRLPFILGPDAESEQWVSEVAKQLNAPYALISKIRRGDRSVDLKLPELSDHSKNLILVDDIISSGASMLAALKQIRLQGFKDMLCIAVHALFDRRIYNDLLSAGATQVITCNTVPHFTNGIDIAELISAKLKERTKCAPW